MLQSFFTCRRFVESLSAWHDGELTDTARASFEVHRSGCNRCAQYAVAFRGRGRACEERPGRLGSAHRTSRGSGPVNPCGTSESKTSVPRKLRQLLETPAKRICQGKAEWMRYSTNPMRDNRRWQALLNYNLFSQILRSLNESRRIAQPVGVSQKDRG